jgi:hypothetical protein
VAALASSSSDQPAGTLTVWPGSWRDSRRSASAARP